jgi:acyl-CoA reductase-like NAD-dependent aldehyde dehydrogenase
LEEGILLATETATAYSNVVGGEWVDAADGAIMDVINPYTQIKHVMAKIG